MTPGGWISHDIQQISGQQTMGMGGTRHFKRHGEIEANSLLQQQ